MKVFLLLLSVVVVLGKDQPQSDVGYRHGAAYPDRYYPGGGSYPGRHNQGGGSYPGRHNPGGDYYPDRYPGSGNPYVRPSGCKNWCRRDNYYPGQGRQQYYCCDYSAPVVYPQTPYPYPPIQQKICPASPAVCTRVYSQFGAPTECYSDSECATTDLCCYDVCLKHKTCKTADYVEGSHRPVRPVRPYPGRPGYNGRPRPQGIVSGLIGSLFGRSVAFDEPHADEPVALRSGKDKKAEKLE